MSKSGRGSKGLLIALVAIILLGGAVALARHGLVDLARLTAERDALRAENQALLKQNQQLMAEIEGLKKDPQAIEAAAREELGLAKEGEIVYRFKTEAAEEAEKKPNGQPGPGSKNQD